MRPLSLVVTLLLAGCGAMPVPKLDLAPTLTPTAAQPAARVARADEPPLAMLDCDRDGLVSHDELAAGFTLNGAPVAREAFDVADLSRDGKWTKAEFARFLNHRPVRSWSVHRPCPPAADPGA